MTFDEVLQLGFAACMIGFAFSGFLMFLGFCIRQMVRIMKHVQDI